MKLKMSHLKLQEQGYKTQRHVFKKLPLQDFQQKTTNKDVKLGRHKSKVLLPKAMNSKPTYHIMFDSGQVLLIMHTS